MQRRKLPIGGVQVFKTLRKEYDVYVDKTWHIYEMAEKRRYQAVFLARPRRFGKSLLCSTIESMFRGEKELFDGLYLSKTDWQWEEHPVIYLDLSTRNYTEDNGVEILKDNLNRQLKICAENYGLILDFTQNTSSNLELLIEKLFQKIGSVVIIIDEYDSPLLSTINQEELNRKLREELKGFYAVLKQHEKYLRFSFITGVTKFSQVSLFSGMNQPKDISMMLDFCDICGITQNELEENFAPEIDEYAKLHGGKEAYLNKLKEFYNGYCFTEKKLSVYNTYGLLNHFTESAKFAPYWSLTGVPTFVLKYMEMKNLNVAKIEEAQMEAGKFGDYRDNSITLFPLLYQAGYLTITDYNETTNLYKLNYPNVEIRKNFAEFLSNHYCEAEETLKSSVSVRLVRFLLDGKTDDFMNLLKIYLQRVDYSLSSKITEFYFEFAVSNIINMLGLVCVNEAHTANGRMDSVIHAGQYIYIFEFKTDVPVEDALWQIEEKDYGLMFADSGKTLVKVGVVFSRENRNIVEWKLGNV